MQRLNPWYFLALFLLLFILFCCAVPDAGYDKYFWIAWTKDIAENGLGSIYLNPEVNNFPLILYLLKLFSLFTHPGSIDAFSINNLKCFVIVFDLATLLLIVFLLKKNSKPLLLCLVFLLNPAFWYNTIIWGQVDAIHTFFVFAALLFTFNKKPLPAIIFIQLALNAKLQSVIFLPLIFLLVYPSLKTMKMKPVFLIPAVAGLQLLILLPFIIAGNFQQTIQSLLHSSVDFYPTVSRNAYNMWYLIFNDPLNTSDGIVFLLPLKVWGILLFVLFYAFVIFLFMKKRGERQSPERIFLVFTLIALSFFYFNTQMHERYVHPVILFSGLYGIFSKRYFIFIICSFAYLLNLEAVMQTFAYFDDEVFDFVINYKTWVVFNPILISLLFLASIIGGIIDLQRNITYPRYSAPQNGNLR